MEILNLGGSQEPSARPSKKKFKVVLGIGLLAGVMGIGSTLAATVQINTGATVEFGQGVAATTACDSSLTVTPGTTYVNDTQTSGSTANFQMRSIVLSGLNITDKSSDGLTEGCGGNWLILKAYTAYESYTAYTVGGSTQNSLYLGWKYPSPKVNGGNGAGAGYVAYNSGIALEIDKTGEAQGTCTATAIGVSGSVDVSGATCVLTGGADNAMIATVTLGDNGGGAGYGVLAGAVQKITVETSGSAPSGYLSTTVS